MIGRGRLYGVWLEGVLRGATETSDVEGVWAELEEIELVGVVGETKKVEDFLGGLKALRSRKLALLTLIRIYAFSTGQLSLHLDLPSIPFHLYHDRFPPTLPPPSLPSPSSSTSVELPNLTATDSTAKDPTFSLSSFLRSLDGSSTIDLRLSFPVEDITPEFVAELAESLLLYTPKLKTLSLEPSTGSKVSTLSR